MDKTMGIQATGDLQVKSIRGCVLFDPKTGEIRHLHRVVTLVGADETPEKEMADRALRLAKEAGIDCAALEVLHVDAGRFAPGQAYKVDTAKRRLVKVRGPRRPA